MKRYVALLLTIAMFPALGGDDTDLAMATVNAPFDGFLALRSEPSTQRGRRLKKIPHGTVLELERCDVREGENNWCLTCYGRRGWVYERYLSPLTASIHRDILSAVAEACPKDWCVASADMVLGDYAQVSLDCMKPACDDITAYLKRANGKWTLEDYGTGIDRDDLIRMGFPADVAKHFLYFLDW